MSIQPWNMDDSQHRMAHAQPLDGKPYFSADVTYKGSVRAVLKGVDAEELKDRAHRFAIAQGWRRAAVTVSRD